LDCVFACGRDFGRIAWRTEPTQGEGPTPMVGSPYEVFRHLRSATVRCAADRLIATNDETARSSGRRIPPTARTRCNSLWHRDRVWMSRFVGVASQSILATRMAGELFGALPGSKRCVSLLSFRSTRRHFGLLGVGDYLGPGGDAGTHL